MPIFDIFSKRQRKLRGETPDVYQYDQLPGSLRVQIIHIMLDVLGNLKQYDYTDYIDGDTYRNVRIAYNFVTDTLCREYGVFRLPVDYEGHENKMMDLRENKMTDLIIFFYQTKDIDKALDVIELSFHAVDIYTRDYWYLQKGDSSEAADRAIQELNDRFKEHRVGYYYTNGKIVRIDSEFVHSEVVQPALRILNRKEYAGAQQEFLQAHEHYRAGRTKEALNECLKSLESVMKSICDRRGWSYDQGAGANKLIGICFDNGIVPPFWQAQFTALKSSLESGVPTARNKLGGHGQGAAPQPVPDHIAGYVLHMTAAAVVFLAEAEASGAGA